MLLSHLIVSRYLGQEKHTSPPIMLSHLPTYHHKQGWLTLGGRTARRGKRAEDSPPQAPRARAWSTWLHSCSTDDNHTTCSQLTAREAGKGHPVGSQRLAIILLLWKKKEGLCWTAHGLCHIHQNAHMAMIAKWGYGYFYFLLYIGIGIFLTFLYCPRGVYKITVMVIILGSWSQTAWRQISLTNWVSWDQWLPLHDSPFSSMVSRGTVVEPTSWAVVRIEAVKTYNMATVTVGKLNWVPLALP